MMDGVEWARIPSPIGPLGVAVTGSAVAAVRFEGPAGPVRPAALLDTVREQLDGYFAGTRTEFSLPLAQLAGSAFELPIWAQIPTGGARRGGATATNRHGTVLPGGRGSSGSVGPRQIGGGPIRSACTVSTRSRSCAAAGRTFGSAEKCSSLSRSQGDGLARS